MIANGIEDTCQPVSLQVKKISYKAGSLGGFYNLAKNFLHTTQKKDIPYDDFQNLKDYVDNGDHTSKEIYDKVKPLLAYEASLIALLVIGILYCVFTPLVGAIFCCCRCCGNCGGKRYQEIPVSRSYCFAYVGILIAIFAFILAGCILYGVNNNKAWKEVRYIF